MSKTKEKTKEYIKIMQAYLDGKKIEFRNRAGDTIWRPADKNHGWNFHDVEYRIKPEPREFWLNVYPDGSLFAHFCPESAVHILSNGETIKVIEVLDDDSE